MISLVYIAMQQKNDMIDDHYYQKELAYQGQLNAQNNLNAISLHSLVSQNANEVVLKFPEGSFEQMTGGVLELLRTDDNGKDKQYPFTATREGTFSISKDNLFKGMYKIRVDWKNMNVPYYFEENVFVDK
jgi:hypothetical protein